MQVLVTKNMIPITISKKYHPIHHYNGLYKNYSFLYICLKEDNMEIHHLAIWTENIETIKEYYIKHFGAKANDKYVNESSGFSSYFLSFEEGANLEIMHRDDIQDNLNDTVKQHKGLIHFAFLVNTRKEVDDKARELADAGYRILRGPRVTGDGYYEFETLDPENNRLEIMAKTDD